ncbi:MAG: protein kinase [Gammaproteobacteria bacterium]
MSDSSLSYAHSRRISPNLKSYRHALPNGYRLLWYRTERVLGQGGFGITYLANDTNLDRHVALKEYLPIDLALREGDHSVHPITVNRAQTYRWGLDRFVAEARALARFKHPNIVRVHTVFEANNTAYMVMEYEQGADLEALFSAHRYTHETDLLALMFPLLDGLEHMHAAGFIHRDIKPSNIYVRTNGSPVLLDFGSARMALGTQTQNLTGLFTPGYAPYEQYGGQGGRQGPWGDIYALGATLYRAVAARPPVDAISRGEAQLGRRRDPLSPAMEVGKGQYSPRFLLAIDAALRFSPSERPQDIASWRRCFPPPSSQAARRLVVPRWLRHTAEFGALGLAGILIGVALVTVLLPEHRPPPAKPAAPQSRPETPPPPARAPDEPLLTPAPEAPPAKPEVAQPAVEPSKAVPVTVDDAPPEPRPPSVSVVAPVTPETTPAPEVPVETPSRSPPAVPAGETTPTAGPPSETPGAIPKQRPAAPQASLKTALADYHRALQYATGEGVPKDDTQAAAWLLRSAEQGYAEAQYQLGLLHDQGKGVVMDPSQAAHWYQKAAAQRVAAAQHNLAVLYDRGKGIEADPEKAAKWYAEAAAQGLPAAQVGLALLYEKGRGIPQDFEQAARWYRAAATQGWAAAQYNLGLLYEQGKGVEKDPQQALAWYEKAAKQGLPPAQFSLGLLYDEGKGVEQQYSLAVQWYRRAAEQGFEKAQASLGYMYGMGRGVPRDDRHAYAWFALAARRGNQEAQRNRDLAAGKLTREELHQARQLLEQLHAKYSERSP